MWKPYAFAAAFLYMNLKQKNSEMSWFQTEECGIIYTFMLSWSWKQTLSKFQINFLIKLETSNVVRFFHYEA